MKSLKQLSGLIIAGAIIFSVAGFTSKKDVQFELGIASYSLRKFPVEKTLSFTKQLGINNTAFKSFHLALDASDEEIAATVQKCKDAGINLYGAGVVYMKSKEQVDQAFDYAKKAGMDMIIGVPNHELLPYVEKKVKEYDIKLAIHNHGPGDELYPSAESAYVLIKDMDPRMGLRIDIGHTTRIQRDPSDDVADYFDRVLDIHIKDVTKAAADGKTCEVGRGVIDIPAFLSSLIDLGYSGIVSLEYEKDADDPFVGMAESVGYINGVLDTLTE
jgi:sugar phosphate isomerase/epimerase